MPNSALQRSDSVLAHRDISFFIFFSMMAYPKDVNTARAPVLCTETLLSRPACDGPPLPVPGAQPFLLFVPAHSKERYTGWFTTAFIHPPTEEHLGGLQVLVMKFAMNIRAGFRVDKSDSDQTRWGFGVCFFF